MRSRLTTASCPVAARNCRAGDHATKLVGLDEIESTVKLVNWSEKVEAESASPGGVCGGPGNPAEHNFLVIVVARNW